MGKYVYQCNMLTQDHYIKYQHNLVFRRFRTMATITSTSSMAPPIDPPTAANTETCFSANQDIIYK